MPEEKDVDKNIYPVKKPSETKDIYEGIESHFESEHDEEREGGPTAPMEKKTGPIVLSLSTYTGEDEALDEELRRQPGPIKAEVTLWGLDKDAYKVGDKVKARIEFKNVGDTDITKIEVQGSIEKDFLGKFVKLIGDRIMVPISRLKPGETERYEQTATVPNFPGRYRINAKVIANGQDTGNFQRIIEVAR